MDSTRIYRSTVSILAHLKGEEKRAKNEVGRLNTPRPFERAKFSQSLIKQDVPFRNVLILFSDIGARMSAGPCKPNLSFKRWRVLVS